MFDTIKLDQHDLIGIFIIFTSFVLKCFNLIDGVTLLGALGVASGLILASNVPIMSGK
jgi:hypothetical protein